MAPAADHCENMFIQYKVPQFLYFSDYEVLPSKSNLSDLAQRASQAKSDPKRLVYRPINSLT